MTASTRGFTFKPATIDDVPVLTRNMLTRGLQDFERVGQHPILSLALYMYYDDSYLFYGPDGSLYGSYGVSDDNYIWIQMTNKVKENPRTTARFGKALMEHINRPFLWTTIDIENTALINLAKYLGFKVLRVFPDGPDNVYSIEIVRLWL
jgi:RimJ/RimL family protein N-acetyltransferase